MSYCCYFSQFTTSKPRSIVFIAIVRTRAGEKNNLKLPFPSQSNIIEKKKKTLAGRMLDPQGFFFFWSYLQELSLVLQVSESEFLSMGCTGSIWKAGRCSNNEAGLPLHLGHKSHRRVYKKQDKQENILPQAPKKLQPLVILFFFFFFSHTGLFIYSMRSWTGEEKKRSERFLTRFHAGVTHVQRGRRCAGIVPSALGGISLTPRLWLQLIKDQDTACWVCFIDATVSVKPDSFWDTPEGNWVTTRW